METTQENVTPLPKGFKFKYETFDKFEMFVMAFRKVYTCTTYPNFKSAYRIKRLGDAIQKELNTYADMKKGLDTSAEDYAEKLNDLHSVEVDIKWDRMNEAEINAIQGLSPTDILMLENVIDPSVLA